MAALAGAAVLLTLSLLLFPTFVKVRTALARAQGARLVAVAQSAVGQLPDSLAIALGSRASDSAAISASVRSVIRRIRVANNDVLGAGNELLGLDIVARDGTGQFHYVLQSERMTTSGDPWTPADLLDELVSNRQSGSTTVYDANGDEVLAAAVPIVAANRRVVGAVVADRKSVV